MQPSHLECCSDTELRTFDCAVDTTTDSMFLSPGKIGGGDEGQNQSKFKILVLSHDHIHGPTLLVVRAPLCEAGSSTRKRRCSALRGRSDSGLRTVMTRRQRMYTASIIQNRKDRSVKGSHFIEPRDNE